VLLFGKEKMGKINKSKDKIIKMDKSLEDWRKQIDVIDEKLLDILAKRIEVVKEIGEYKKANGIRPLDKKRWQEIMQSKLAKAKLLNVPEKFVKNIYNLIHKHSLELEKEI